MELFGIMFSIPVAFVVSMFYCAILAHGLRQFERLTFGFSGRAVHR